MLIILKDGNQFVITAINGCYAVFNLFFVRKCDSRTKTLDCRLKTFLTLIVIGDAISMVDDDSNTFISIDPLKVN